MDTYAAMFSAWVDYLEQRRMHVVEAVAEDATGFFDSHALEPLSRRRYLQLLDRVYLHLHRCGRAGESPIQVELSKERELERSFPPALSVEQQEALTTHLRSLSGWKGDRDRAMGALMAGAGLRANELIRLTLADVDAAYAIDVRPRTVHRHHTSLISPDGDWRAWFDTWLQVRAHNRIPGTLVIPATAKGNAYDPSGLFRRVRGWLDGATIVAEQSGPNLLRSTFARNSLASGRYSVQEVCEFLGHQTTRATERHMSEGEADG